MKKVIQKTIVLLFLIFNLFDPVIAAEQVQPRLTDGRYEENVQQITINNAVIEYQKSGDGEVVIVFESGFGSGLKVWKGVVELLPKNIQTLTYSRAEVLPSNASIKPRTIASHVNDLKVLLTKLKINKPIILVAHSYGGLIAADFAKRYVQNLRGIVLVDPATLSQRHQFKMFDEKMVDNEDKLLNKVLPKHLKSTYDLLIKQMEAAPFHNLPLPEQVPAIILTAIKPHPKPMVVSETVEGKKIWFNLHQELISNKEIQISQQVDSSDHNLHLSNPKMIASAILQLISDSL